MIGLFEQSSFPLLAACYLGKYAVGTLLTGTKALAFVLAIADELLAREIAERCFIRQFDILSDVDCKQLGEPVVLSPITGYSLESENYNFVEGEMIAIDLDGFVEVMLEDLLDDPDFVVFHARDRIDEGYVEDGFYQNNRESNGPIVGNMNMYGSEGPMNFNEFIEMRTVDGETYCTCGCVFLDESQVISCGSHSEFYEPMIDDFDQYSNQTFIDFDLLEDIDDDDDFDVRSDDTEMDEMERIEFLASLANFERELEEVAASNSSKCSLKSSEFSVNININNVNITNTTCPFSTEGQEELTVDTTGTACYRPVFNNFATNVELKIQVGSKPKNYKNKYDKITKTSLGTKRRFVQEEVEVGEALNERCRGCERYRKAMPKGSLFCFTCKRNGGRQKHDIVFNEDRKRVFLRRATLYDYIKPLLDSVDEVDHRNQLLLSGDVELNPGPVCTICYTSETESRTRCCDTSICSTCAGRCNERSAMTNGGVTIDSDQEEFIMLTMPYYRCPFCRYCVCRNSQCRADDQVNPRRTHMYCPYFGGLNNFITLDLGEERFVHNMDLHPESTFVPTFQPQPMGEITAVTLANFYLGMIVGCRVLAIAQPVMFVPALIASAAAIDVVFDYGIHDYLYRQAQVLMHRSSPVIKGITKIAKKVGVFCRGLISTLLFRSGVEQNPGPSIISMILIGVTADQIVKHIGKIVGISSLIRQRIAYESRSYTNVLTLSNRLFEINILEDFIEVNTIRTFDSETETIITFEIERSIEGNIPYELHGIYQLLFSIISSKMRFVGSLIKTLLLRAGVESNPGPINLREVIGGVSVVNLKRFCVDCLSSDCVHTRSDLNRNGYEYILERDMKVVIISSRRYDFCFLCGDDFYLGTRHVCSLFSRIYNYTSTVMCVCRNILALGGAVFLLFLLSGINLEGNMSEHYVVIDGIVYDREPELPDLDSILNEIVLSSSQFISVERGIYAYFSSRSCYGNYIKRAVCKIIANVLYVFFMLSGVNLEGNIFSLFGFEELQAYITFRGQRQRLYQYTRSFLSRSTPVRFRALRNTYFFRYFLRPGRYIYNTMIRFVLRLEILLNIIFEQASFCMLLYGIFLLSGVNLEANIHGDFRTDECSLKSGHCDGVVHDYVVTCDDICQLISLCDSCFREIIDCGTYCSLCLCEQCDMEGSDVVITHLSTCDCSVVMHRTCTCNFECEIDDDAIVLRNQNVDFIDECNDDISDVSDMSDVSSEPLPEECQCSLSDTMSDINDEYDDISLSSSDYFSDVEDNISVDDIYDAYIAKVCTFICCCQHHEGVIVAKDLGICSDERCHEGGCKLDQEALMYALVHLHYGSRMDDLE